MAEVSKLIAKQVSLWELRRRAETADQRPGRRQVGDFYFGPYLLISRQHGSGGDMVARQLGERLGWQVFDRQIVDAVAERAQVRRQLISSLDEHARTVWEETFRAALAPEDFGSETFLSYLHQVVMALGHQGEVVLVGRGAPFMLPRECGLRVRVVAPLAWRAARVAASDNCSQEVARRQVLQTDHDRVEFIRKCFRLDVNDPVNHDLVLNTAELGLEGAVELALLALQHKLGVQPVK